MRAICAAVAIVLATGCTTLGPVPSTTAMSAMPAGRPSATVQFGAVPGHYLSAGVVKSPQGAGLTQGSLLFEPDRIIHVPGLVVGVRAVGQSGDTQVDPVVGYRQALGDERRVALAGFVYGAHGSGTHKSASYSANRFGLEVAAEVRVSPVNRWAEVHVTAGASVNYLSAKGDYCLDAGGVYGAECPDPPATPVLTHTDVSGAYPSANAGVALDIGAHFASVFQGGRIALLGAAGALPRVTSGLQRSASAYLALGLSLSASFGAKH